MSDFGAHRDPALAERAVLGLGLRSGGHLTHGWNVSRQSFDLDRSDEQKRLSKVAARALDRAGIVGNYNCSR